MRWLVLTSSVPRYDGDFSGLFVQSFCEALAARGHRLDVLAWRGEGALARTLGDEGTGVELRFVPYGPPSMEELFYGAGAPENLRESPLRALLAPVAMGAMVGAALKACREVAYDGVIGHWLLPAGALARVVGEIAGLPSFVVGHSGGVHLLSRVPPVVGRPLARWLTAVPTTVPTEALAQTVRALGGEVTSVLPMGFDPPSEGVEFGGRRGVGELRVGFLGRLVAIKDLGTLLGAIEEARAGGVSVTLEIVGDGPERQRWQAQAGDGVTFRGALMGEAKEEALRSWDVLALPSRVRESGRHEGLPVTLLEAAARGTVPLVSGVPGAEEWLVRPWQVLPAGQSSEWARGIAGFADLDDRALRELRWASAEQVASLQWPRLAADFERIFCAPEGPGV